MGDKFEDFDERMDALFFKKKGDDINTDRLLEPPPKDFPDLDKSGNELSAADPRMMRAKSNN